MTSKNLKTLKNSKITREKKQDRKVCMSVPSYKGTRLQGCGRPWYRGYGTTQEQRTWLYGQPPGVVQTTKTASSTMQSWPSALILQSVEAYFKL